MHTINLALAGPISPQVSLKHYLAQFPNIAFRRQLVNQDIVRDENAIPIFLLSFDAGLIAGGVVISM